MARMNVKGSVFNTNNNITDQDGYAIPPIAANLGVGQFAVNTSETDPCIFFKTNAGKVVKIVSEEKLTKALTEILGNSAADLATLRELIALFEGSANDILPMLTALTDRVTAAETSLTSKADKSALNTTNTNLSNHTGNTSNPHSVTKAQVGLSNVLDKEQLGKDETAVSAQRLSVTSLFNDADANPTFTGLSQTSVIASCANYPATTGHALTLVREGGVTTDSNLKTQFFTATGSSSNLWFRKSWQGSKTTGWLNIYHSGNSNNDKADWTCKSLKTFADCTFWNSTRAHRLTINTQQATGRFNIYSINSEATRFGLIEIGSNGGNALVVDGEGKKVGIGTPTPTEMLDVSGNILAANMFIGNATTKKQVWHAGNSNIPTANWTCKTLTCGNSSNSGLIDAVVASDRMFRVTGQQSGDVKIQSLRSSKGDYRGLALEGDAIFFRTSEGGSPDNLSTKMTILPNGNIGVGDFSNTSHPEEKFHVNGNGKFSGNCYVGGNAGFGTNNPTDRLHAVGNIRATEKGIFGGNVESSGSGIFAGDVIAKKTGAVTFSTSDAAAGATRLNDLIDVKLPTTLSAKMVLAYDPAQTNSDGSKGGYTFMPSAGTGTGTVTSAEITSLPEHNHNDIVYASDERLKENVIPLRNATIMLNNLRPKEYNWNEKGNKLGLKDPKAYGLIAQEVENLREIIDLVKPLHGGESGYLGVDYVKLIPVLVAGFQEQHSEIIEAKNTIKSVRLSVNKAYSKEVENSKKIESLENKVRDLETLLNK